MDRRTFLLAGAAAPLAAHPFFAHAQPKTMKDIQAMHANWKSVLPAGVSVPNYAFRLFAPDVELSLSTRESPYFRDHMIPVAINSVSAGSKTQPGGYADDVPPELEQFEPHDGRTPQQVAEAISNAGLQPVWKDWDDYLGRSAQ